MKKLIFDLANVLGVVFILVLGGCSNSPKDVAGTGSGTESALVMGHIYYPDGTPASNAIVQLIAADQDPRTSSLVAATVTTDVNGRYSIKSLTAKTYNLLAEGDSGKAFHDSIKVDDDTLELSDTLHDPGILRGIVKLEGDIDTGYIFVILLGTNTYATADTNGNFTLADMPAGTYNTLVLTTVPEYASVDTELTVHVGADEWMNDTIFLRNTGVPIPENLSITYDTLRQIVTLTWAKADTALAKGYYVYRRNVDSNTILTRINTSPITDTLYRDSTGIQDQTYEYRVSAIDKNATEGTKSAGVSVTIVERFVLVNDSISFGARSEHTSLAFDSKIWVIAGNLLNDIWSSTDGISWTKVVDSTAFSRRRSHASVVFNNEMWVIGGKDADRFQDDVWHSSDGINWLLATDSAGFSGRMDHAAVVFENKIWVIGGYDGVSEKNDVWQSDDGITWTKVTENASFSARSGLTVDVFNNELVVIGGVGPANYYNDVWSSNDGITWKVVSANGGFPGIYEHTATVFQNQIWIVGGEKATGGYSNEVWSSSDGKNWLKFNTPNNFTAKYNHSAVVADNKLWIIGCAMLSDGSLNKTDLWYLK